MGRVLSVVGVWAGLVAVFVAFYRYFSARNDEPSLWLIPVVLFGVAAIFAFFLLRGRGAAAVCNEGVALLGKGHALEALERFEAARPRLPSNPLIYMNLGVANLWLWRLEEADRQLRECRRRRWATNLERLVVPVQALVCALMGRLETAREFIAEAASKQNDDASSVILAQAVIRCRERDFAGAAALLQRSELRACGGLERGIADALKAWCAFEITGERREIEAVALYGEAGPEGLRAAWPEFSAFIETHSRALPKVGQQVG